MSGPGSGTLLALAVLLTARTSSAQAGDAERTAAAQSLFDRALELEAQKNFAEACPKLEEVVRLEPGGLGAKLRLADCYEQGGRLASAWTAYVVAADAATAAGQEPRAKFARDRAEALKPRLPRILIVVPPAVAGLPGLEVRRDAIVLGEAQWAASVPVDPGRHTITVAATGKVRWTKTVDVLPDAPSLTVNVPELAADASPGSGAKSAGPDFRPGGGPRPSPQEGGVPAWAWALGATGVALTAASVGFLVDERSIQSTIHERCGPVSCDTAGGFDPEAANSRLDRDFVLFVALGATGVIALGASVFGIVTAPSSRPAAAFDALPWVASSGAGARLGGQF